MWRRRVSEAVYYCLRLRTLQHSIHYPIRAVDQHLFNYLVVGPKALHSDPNVALNESVARVGGGYVESNRVPTSINGRSAATKGEAVRVLCLRITTIRPAE